MLEDHSFDVDHMLLNYLQIMSAPTITVSIKRLAA